MNERKRKTFFFHNRAGFLMERKNPQGRRFGQRVKHFSLFLSPPRWLDRLILFYLILFSIIWLFPISFIPFSTMCAARRKEISLGLGHGPITATWRVVVVALLRCFSPVGASYSSSGNRIAVIKDSLSI
jgi:hypothetical protein